MGLHSSMQYAVVGIKGLSENGTIDVDALRNRDGALLHAAVKGGELGLRDRRPPYCNGAAAFGDRDALELASRELVEHVKAARLEVARGHGSLSVHRLSGQINLTI